MNSAGFPRATAAWIMTAALTLYMLLQTRVRGAVGPDRAQAADGRVRHRGDAGDGADLPDAGACPARPYAAFALVVAALVIVSGYTAINAVVKAELFPAHIRTLGVALPYALANALFGGTAEWVALGLKKAGVERGFYWYVAAMIAVSLVTYWRMPDTRDASRILED